MCFQTSRHTSHKATMQPVKYLEINEKIAIIFAAWPLEYKTKSFIKKQLYNVYYRSVRLFFLSFVITQWIQTYFIVRYGDFQELMDNISVALDYSIGVAQLFTCMSERAIALIYKVNKIEEEILQDGHEDEDVIEIYKNNCRKNVWLNRGFVAIALFTVFLFFLMPLVEMNIIESDGVKPLPFSSWFPFDKNYYYGFAYTIQVIAGVYSCQFVVCTDLLFFSFMIFSIGQLKMLQIVLKKFEKQNGSEKRLREHIEKHQIIIE